MIISFGLLKTNKLKENLEMKEAIIKIVNIVDKYSTKSFRKRNYKFLFDTDRKEIKIYNLINKSPIEIITLPQRLDYKIPYGCVYKNIFIFDSTLTSNLDKAFSVYVCDSEIIKCRISFYLFRTSKIIKINVYKVRKSKVINAKKILKNYRNEKWMKEG